MANTLNGVGYPKGKGHLDALRSVLPKGRFAKRSQYEDTRSRTLAVFKGEPVEIVTINVNETGGDFAMPDCMRIFGIDFTSAKGVVLTGFLSLSVAGHAADGAGIAGRAAAFLAALTEDQREEATWAFDDEERTDVHFAPIGLDGIRHDDLSGVASDAADALLKSALSDEGYAKAHTIRLLERDVEQQESMFRRPLGLRDPGRYFLAVFGTPTETQPWAFRYEGHHLSINVTAIPGQPAVTTPLFLGAQPRVVPSGMPSAGVAALGEEERVIRALYTSLDATQRATATLLYAADRGHMIGQVPLLPAPTPIGLARASMRPAQQELLDALLERFAALWVDEIATARRRDIDNARGSLHFAHVQADEPANAFYTRVSGTGLLLEIDNTDGGDHVHAVWHKPGADFGDDLLARHLESEHGRVIREITLARDEPAVRAMRSTDSTTTKRGLKNTIQIGDRLLPATAADRRLAHGPLPLLESRSGADGGGL